MGLFNKGNGASFVPPAGAVLKGEAKELWEKYFVGKAGCFGKRKFMKDEEFLRRIDAKFAKFSPKARGLEKFGLDADEVAEIAPVDIFGFYWGVQGDSVVTGPTWKCTNRPEITWLYFSDRQLYAYTLRIDMLSESYDEIMNEYFYEDITNILTMDETIEKEKWSKGCFKAKKSYEMVTKTYIKLACPGTDGFKQYVTITHNPDFANKIKSLKLKIREKKAL